MNSKLKLYEIIKYQYDDDIELEHVYADNEIDVMYYAFTKNLCFIIGNFIGYKCKYIDTCGCKKWLSDKHFFKHCKNETENKTENETENDSENETENETEKIYEWYKRIKSRISIEDIEFVMNNHMTRGTYVDVKEISQIIVISKKNREYVL